MPGSKGELSDLPPSPGQEVREKDTVIICRHTSVEAKLKLKAASSSKLCSFRGKKKKQFRNTINVLHVTHQV